MCWKLSYRFMGQQKAMTVGPWPMISLADARARATELRRQVHDGIDPALEKQLRKFNTMKDRHSNFRAIAVGPARHGDQTGSSSQ